jgi:ribosomal protein S14
MTEEKKFQRHKKGCSLCGSQKAVISKYKLNICRRCFKQNAEKLGFKKFD